MQNIIPASKTTTGQKFYRMLTLHSASFNPFNPEFTIVIFIHYKPRIAVAILDL